MLLHKRYRQWLYIGQEPSASGRLCLGGGVRSQQTRDFRVPPCIFFLLYKLITSSTEILRAACDFPMNPASSNFSALWPCLAEASQAEDAARTELHCGRGWRLGAFFNVARGETVSHRQLEAPETITLGGTVQS